MEPRELMLSIRAWQRTLNDHLKANRFRIPIHLAFGYEGLAVAMDDVTSKACPVVLHHRNIAYQLAFQKCPRAVAAEFLGESDGLAGGRLGSMNLASGKIFYTTSILGNGLPVACGLALSRGTTVFVVFGDGAIEEGAFYESLLFARSHGLRVVFVQENNDRSMASTIAERRCPVDWAMISHAVGVPHFSSDATLDGCRRALAAAAEAHGPAFVEVRLPAFNNHAGATPGWPTDPLDLDFTPEGFLRPVEADPLHDAWRDALDECQAAWQKLQAVTREELL